MIKVQGFRGISMNCVQQTHTHHINDPALKDAVGKLVVVLVWNGRGQLLPLSKLVGSFLLGSIGLCDGLGSRNPGIFLWSNGEKR